MLIKCFITYINNLLKNVESTVSIFLKIIHMTELFNIYLDIVIYYVYEFWLSLLQQDPRTTLC